MKGILFLCTGNSCRSQMAEGFGHALKSSLYRFSSAGTKASGLNPYAVKVMQEAGVDISQQKSQTLDEVDPSLFDYVFTLCDDASENCPILPGKKIIHRGFDDPPRLVQGLKEEAEVLQVYRRVRDEVKEFVSQIDKALVS